MKITLNTTASNKNISNQNNPNFKSRTPVFIFPKEQRLMPCSTSLFDRFCNAFLSLIQMERRNPIPSRHFSQTLWNNITRFVHDGQLGEAETFTVGGSPRLHQVRAFTDEGEKTIAQKLKELGVKFAQVELD